MREIPKLQVLCLRVVGSHSCSGEDTFASDPQTGEPSKASRLLRLFHKRPIVLSTDDIAACIAAAQEDHQSKKIMRAQAQQEQQAQEGDNGNTTGKSSTMSSIEHVPMARTLCVGQGSSRRTQANDVDLNHPIIAHRYNCDKTKEDSKDGNNSAAAKTNTTSTTNTSSTTTTSTTALVMEYGNPALDLLQSYIDALAELGRMDDGRLGVHFFEEWKANVLVGAGKDVPIKKPVAEKEEDEENAVMETLVEADADAAVGPPPNKRSRRRSSTSNAATADDTRTTTATTTTTTLRVRVKTSSGPPPPLGSLSLSNCAVAEDTIEAMRDSGMGLHLAVLDLTGIYSLTDVMLEQFLPHCPNLQRFSVKNCRRVTVATLHILVQYQTKLVFLDIGGTYNITPQQVLDTLLLGGSNNHVNNNTNNNNNNRSTTTTNKNQPCPELIELHVSGLGWNDAYLKALVDGTSSDTGGNNNDDENNNNGMTNNNDEENSNNSTPATTRSWKALSLGFSTSLSAMALRQSLSKISSTLISLALHFCEHVVDNALMGILGRNLPHVRFLDVRGNPSLSSMTGWYDGRASADFYAVSSNTNEPEDDTVNNDAYNINDNDDDEAAGQQAASLASVQELTVLAKFTSITKASLEDTLRIHPLHATKLTCILDSGGAGVGIYR